MKQMSDKIFIDTNILVYIVKDNTLKSVELANKIPDKSIISIQVVNEFSNVALKKLTFAVSDVLNISKK